MENKEKVVVPAYSKTIIKSTTCDLCHKDVNAGMDNYDVREIKVSCKEGSNYPDGGFGTKIVVDLCLDCFKGVLIPFLEEKGSTHREEEWDW